VSGTAVCIAGAQQHAQHDQQLMMMMKMMMIDGGGDGGVGVTVTGRLTT